MGDSAGCPVQTSCVGGTFGSCSEMCILNSEQTTPGSMCQDCLESCVKLCSNGGSPSASPPHRSGEKSYTMYIIGSGAALFLLLLVFIIIPSLRRMKTNKTT